MLDHVLCPISVARSVVNVAQDTNKIKGTLHVDAYPSAKDSSGLRQGRASSACVLGYWVLTLPARPCETQLKGGEKLILFNSLWKGCGYFILESNKKEIRLIRMGRKVF